MASLDIELSDSAIRTCFPLCDYNWSRSRIPSKGAGWLDELEDEQLALLGARREK